MSGGGSGGGGNTTTVQKADPWVGQQEYLKDIFTEAQDEYQTTPGKSYFPGQTFADFTPEQTSAQQGVIDYANSPDLQNMQAQAQGALGELSSNPYSNPVFGATRSLGGMGQYGLMNASQYTNQANDVYAPGIHSAYNNANPAIRQMLSGEIQDYAPLQNAANAYSTQATDDFLKNVMPQIRAKQIAYQPGGSSRGDIATGLAAEGLGKNISNNTANLYNQAYQTAQAQKPQAAGLVAGMQSNMAGLNLGAQNLWEQGRGSRAGESLGLSQGAFDPALSGESAINQRLGLAGTLYPNIASQPFSYLGAQNAVGDARQAQNQSGYNEAIDRFNYDQNKNAAALAGYHNLISGNLGGTQSSSQSFSGSGGNQFAQGLTGALGGAGAAAGGFSLLSGMPMAAASPWTLGAGALLGLGSTFL